MAEGMEKYHILFEEAGIKKGDKIAIYARNSAEWCIAYYATLTYDAVTVPFLPDFLPAAVAELGSFSECKMLIIDDVAFNAMNATPELYEQLEKTKGFAGVLNIKDMSVLRDTTGRLAKVHENMSDMLSARHPNGLTADRELFCQLCLGHLFLLPQSVYEISELIVVHRIPPTVRLVLF